MKNVKLIISKDKYNDHTVELWIDGELVETFDSFDSKDEVNAFCEGFRACQNRFCILDKEAVIPAAS
jgi:hypothetical protein